MERQCLPAIATGKFAVLGFGPGYTRFTYRHTNVFKTSSRIGEILRSNLNVLQILRCFSSCIDVQVSGSDLFICQQQYRVKNNIR